MLSRRTAIALAAVFAAGGAMAAPSALSEDMSLGNPKAKIQVIEYASMSCPHCAHFNEAVFAPFKAKYLDTGKAYYTLKEMLTPPEQVAAAGFLTARCAGKDKYFKVVDEVFRSQSRWATGSIKPIFLEIAKANGLTEEQFNTCLTDKPALDALAARVDRAATQDGIQGTPTIFINGKQLTDVPANLADMDAAIAKATAPGGH
jgi:protein-disulfide isomerase